MMEEVNISGATVVGESEDELDLSSTSRAGPMPEDSEDDDQERLSSSLLALTTHFAQVQFRLKQIRNASQSDREKLLQELEEFTFRGCPDLFEMKRCRKMSTESVGNSGSEKWSLEQLQLINRLKQQLEELECFAYESGEAGPPTSRIMEKQKLIIDRLSDKMHINLVIDESSSNDQVQNEVDQAVKKLTNPIKMKDQLVNQLQTQIADLERFVDFLQYEGGSVVAQNCGCKGNENDHSKNTTMCIIHGPQKLLAAKRIGYEKPRSKKSDNTISILNKTLYLLQIYVLAQLGCQSEKFHRNQLKRTVKGAHYGDCRANLEVAIKQVVDVASKFSNSLKPAVLNANFSEDDAEEDVFEHCPEELVTVIRKTFCPALRDLLQHGRMPSHQDRSLISSVACFSHRSKIDESNDPNIHAWDVIFKYYEIKHGKEFSNDPLRRLSQSFGLENIGGRSVTSKQLLLSTIDTVVASHGRLKRSSDAIFKAFVCAALNHRKLVAWLRMILRTKEIVDELYFPWSYVAKTGFDDACGALEKLNNLNFNLPTDLAIRPFQNIRDVF